MSELTDPTIPAEADRVRDLATQIVSAHVSNNTVPASDLPALVAQVSGSLAKAGDPANSDDAEDSIKTALAWGSLSYACGFVTVMVYTWRLGLPVVELIEPIYVLVGLPVAAVAYFWRWLVLYFKQESSTLIVQLRASAIQITGKDPPGNIDLVGEALRPLVFLPGFRFVRPYLIRFLTARIERVTRHLKTANPDQFERQARRFHRLMGIFAFFAAIERGIGLLSRIAAIPLALIVYVWVVYPLIPQGLGGGRPLDARILVDREAIPPEPPVPAVQTSPAAPTDGASTVIIPVKLLYMTSEYFLVEISSGTRISIKSDVVKAVLWSH